MSTEPQESTKSTEEKERAERDILDNRNDFAWGVREWSIETILEKFGENGDPDSLCELYIPEYQRDYKWDTKIASRFIESILLGFPIPYLYIASVENFEDQNQDGRIEIIDGTQRIRALRYFVNNEFPLSELKELLTLDGFYYKDLLPGRQRKFLRESLRLIELKSDAEGDYRRNLFERINSGVKKLLPMEVRKGSDDAVSVFYRDVIQVCAQDGLFRKLAPLSKSQQSNEDYSELVLRFFGYAEDLENYKGIVKQFLDKYFTEKTQDNNITPKIYVDKFQSMLQFVDTYFPSGFKKNSLRNSISKTYFEAIAVGVQLAFEENNNSFEGLVTGNINSWIQGDEFANIVSSDAANNTSKLKGRIFFVRDKLLGKI